MDKSENPAAFPFRCEREIAPGVTTEHHEPGMSLRDYFAGQALIGLANQHHGNDWGQSGKQHDPICARKAYDIADAMLSERQRRRQS